MTPQLIDTLIYAGTIFVICTILWAVKKFKIVKEDRDFTKMILIVTKALVGNSNFKYRGDIEKIISYTFIAINIVDEYEKLNTVEDKIAMIKNKALELCRDNGIRITSELQEAIDIIFDIVLDNMEELIK